MDFLHFLFITSPSEKNWESLKYHNGQRKICQVGIAVYVCIGTSIFTKSLEISIIILLIIISLISLMQLALNGFKYTSRKNPHPVFHSIRSLKRIQTWVCVDRSFPDQQRGEWIVFIIILMTRIYIPMYVEYVHSVESYEYAFTYDGR